MGKIWRSVPRGLREPQLSKHLQHGNFPRLALRLAGLQVHQRPRTGSPERCAASPPGMANSRVTKVVVARVRRLRRDREKSTLAPSWPNSRLALRLAGERRLLCGFKCRKTAIPLPAIKPRVHHLDRVLNRLGHRVIKADDIRLNTQENHLADILF